MPACYRRILVVLATFEDGAGVIVTSRTFNLPMIGYKIYKWLSCLMRS